MLVLQNTLILLIVLCCQAVYSQRQVLGRVLDEDTDKPINAATISLNNADSITATNYLGFFQITVDSSNLLQISAEGYKSVQFSIPAEDKFQVHLQKQTATEQTAGIKELFEYLKYNLNYPINALEGNIQGKVYASFEIDSLGRLQTIGIHQDVKGRFEKELIRVLKNAPQHWGKHPTSRTYILPVVFAIQNAKPAKQNPQMNLPEGIMLKEISVTAASRTYMITR